MDWKKEKEQQMRAEALAALGLSEKNQELAERYLDSKGLEETYLLKEAEKQDFHVLGREACEKNRDYAGYCEKEHLTEELGRYIQFAAAIGGSTLYYILDDPYKSLEWLSVSQQAAVLAEMAAWEKKRLNRGSLLLLFSIGEKNPRAIRKALHLCSRKGYNVQILLHGIYLYYVKPRGVIVGKYLRETEHAEEMSGHLAKVLTGCFSLLSTNDRFVVEELVRLRNFAEGSEPSEEFPETFHVLFGVRKFSGYLLRLLGGAAFLAIEHSDRFLVFLRILTAMDMEAVLDACLEICGDTWFRSHLEMVEDVLPVPMEDYVQWCVSHKLGEALARISVHFPEAIQKASASLTIENYYYLLDQMRKNMDVYQGLNLAFAGVFRIQAAGELSAWYPAGRAEAKRYLLGTAGPEDIYPFVKDWRAMDQSVRWDYGGERTEKIDRLKADPEKQQMYRRAVVLEGLCLNVLYFCNFHVSGRTEDSSNGMNEEELTAILAVFEQEKIKVKYQIRLLEEICSSGYSEAGKKQAVEACIRVLIHKKEAWNAWYVTGIKDGSVFFRSLCIRVLGSFGDEYKPLLLSCSMDGSAQVRDTLVQVCTEQKSWKKELFAMLGSARAQEREIAVRVLKNWGTDDCRTELKKALASEENNRIRKMIQEWIGTDTDMEEELQSPEALVSAILEGGRKRKAAWALEDMPDIQKTDGSIVSEDERAAFLLCYADQREPGISREAIRIAAEWDAEGLASYTRKLLERWILTDADAKRKWALCAAAIHGGEEVVPAFQTLIQELPKRKRRLLAAEAAKLLALNGSAPALRFVEQMSRKCRYQQIREAAAEAYSKAAAQRNLTEEELRDDLVPDLGLDERGEHIFNYGTRSFRAVLIPAATLEIFDENGKQLRSMPTPGKKEDPVLAGSAYESYKQLKKQLKAVMEDQKRCMERVFLTGRRWKAESWKALFAKKPVMLPFAVGLIWGIYEGDHLSDTFRRLEDGTLQSVSGERYELLEDGQIGLAHPAGLSEEVRLAWKAQLAKQGIQQPIRQLDRPVWHLTEEEKGRTELERFGGIRMNGRLLSGRLLEQEWRRGPVGDGGVYDSFYRTDGAVGAELAISGCHASVYEEETVLYSVCFYRADHVRREKGKYEVIKEQDQYCLGELDPGYVSEILLQLTNAVGAVRERLLYPECREERGDWTT